MSGAGGDWKPRLRGEILRADDAEGQATLLDTLVARKVSLGALSSRVQPLVDGERTVDEILAEAARLLPDRAPAELAGVLRQFLALALVEGSGVEMVRRVRQMQSDDASYPAIVLEGSRWSCLGCGQCCRVYALGPLRSEDVHDLLERDIPGNFPHLPDARFFDVMESRDGEKSMYLRTSEGECVFLDGQGMCRVHAQLGEEAKPGFCRTYPLQAMATLEGWKLYENGECSRFAEAALHGKPMAEHATSARAWFPEDVQIHHPVVFLDDETPYDYGFQLRLQRRLCDILREHGPCATSALVAAGRTAHRFATVLRAFPLLPGEPDASVEAALGGDPDRVEPIDDEADGYVTVATLAKELLDLATEGLARGPVYPLGGEPPPAHDFVSVMHFLIGTAIGRSRGVPTPVCAPPEGDGPREQDWVLRYSLRQQVFGNLGLVDDRLRPAMLRIALSHLATVLGARLSAAREGSPAVELRHLSRGHMVAQWCLRPGRVREVLLRHEARAWRVLETVPYLL